MNKPITNVVPLYDSSWFAELFVPLRDGLSVVPPHTAFLHGLWRCLPNGVSHDSRARLATGSSLSRFGLLCSCLCIHCPFLGQRGRAARPCCVVPT